MLYGGLDGFTVNTGGNSLGVAGALMMDPMTTARMPSVAATITGPITTSLPAGITGGGGSLTLSNASTGPLAYAGPTSAATGAAAVNGAAQTLSAAEAATLVKLLNFLAQESQRQAQLGNDIFGRPINGAEDHQFEQRVLQLVNAERAKAGLGALAYDRQLDTASEAHNQQQIRMGTMAHDGIGDGDPGSRIRATGFANAWGENVATGQTTPEQVVREWMASPGHRRNILDPNFTRLGVAYGTATNGRSYWAQSFGA